MRVSKKMSAAGSLTRQRIEAPQPRRVFASGRATIRAISERGRLAKYSFYFATLGELEFRIGREPGRARSGSVMLLGFWERAGRRVRAWNVKFGTDAGG